MKWIGLTGGIGTGKTTVARMLVQSGIPVVDADRIARQVVEKGSDGLSAVIQAFGPEFLDSEGNLDRINMGLLIFKKPDLRRKLELIIHPLVEAEVRSQKKWLLDQGTVLAFYDVPLLFENHLESQFDAVVVVTCNLENQIRRIQKRNPEWTSEQVKERIHSQMDLGTKEKKANYVIRNDADINFLEKQVADLIKVLEQ